MPGGVWDRLVGFEEVVGERRFFPSLVAFSQLVLGERVGHWSFLISSFLEDVPFRLPGAGDLGSSYHGGS